MNRSIILGVVAVVLVITGYGSMFTVHEATQALVLQLGKPVRVIREPGLNFKLPFVQNVVIFDRRTLDLDPPPQDVVLSDKKRISVDSYMRYRITDPLKFRNATGNEAQFRNRFGNILNNEVRNTMGTVLLGDLLTAKRAQVMTTITDAMKAQAPNFGVEVVDVRIGRTDLPQDTSTAVYNRMRSEREATAAKLRAEGEEIKAKIMADADRQRTIILADAQKTAEILRGEGEGQRTKVLADAFSKDPEFFQFYRSMQAYEGAIGDGTTMILSPDSEFFRYFGKLPKGAK